MRRSIVASGVIAIVLHGFLLYGFRLERPAQPLPPAPGPIVVGLVASVPRPTAIPAPPEANAEPPSTPEPPRPPREDRPTKKPVAASKLPTPKPRASEGATPEEPAEPAPAGSGGGSSAPSATGPAAGAGGPVSSLPRYRNTPAPAYPPSARRAHQQGVVLLSVDVGANGRPTGVVVKMSSGAAILDQAAIRAVRRWTFEPARTAGLPVASTVEVPVRFSLDD